MSNPMIARLGVPFIASGLLIIGAAAPALAAPPSANIPGVQVVAEDTICQVMVTQVATFTKMVNGVPTNPLQTALALPKMATDGVQALWGLASSLASATSAKCDLKTLDDLHTGMLKLTDAMIAKSDVLHVLPFKAPLTAFKTAVLTFAKSQGLDYTDVLTKLDKVIAQFPI